MGSCGFDCVDVGGDCDSFSDSLVPLVHQLFHQFLSFPMLSSVCPLRLDDLGANEIWS